MMDRLCILALVAMMVSVSCAHYSSPLDAFQMKNLRHEPRDDVTLVASPQLLKKSGDWLILKYSKRNPTDSDWIGVYSPANVDFAKTAPVKYQWANYAMNYNTTGSGFLNISLVNMHSDVVFAFFTNGTQQPVFLGKSNVVTFANLEEPLQGHISFTGKDRQLRVAWATGYKAGSQYIQYGVSPGNYTHKVIAVSDTYVAGELCGSPAKDFGWKDPGLLHNVVLTGLAPNLRYYYRYGSDGVSGWSEESSFVGPKVPHPTQKIHFIAFGDMGKADVDHTLEHWQELPSLQTCQHMIENADDLDFVLHIGDIAYAVGYSAQWDQFMEQIKPIASRVPYMTCPGNHERDYPNSGSVFNGTDSGGECGVPYERRFRMPLPGIDKPWFSFNNGPVHFVLMSTEHDFAVGSEQYDWIDRDLKHVDREKTPWVIFSGHRPMYIDSNSTTGEANDQEVAVMLRDAYDEMFVKYGVDLAFWGHHHSYQRSCPVYKGKCQPAGSAPVHVVIGMAGMGLSQNLESTNPDWLVYVDDQEYGYTTVTANSTHIHMKYFGNESGLKDEFVLSKQ